MLDRTARVLAFRGIEQHAVDTLPDAWEPHSAEEAPALGLLPRYREAVVTNQHFLAWVRQVAAEASIGVRWDVSVEAGLDRAAGSADRW
ncbi:hypothetical protein ACFC60_10070 [Kitasatospora purpeofusca]|uniref:hypothetical protein n=1 Tax=Kitasatospora purpeofusca TaxID=67352 RepID=UPI0035D86E84